MKSIRVLGTLLAIIACSVSAYADRASAAYKRGVHAEHQNKYDEAYQAYSEAHSLKPKDAKYYTAYVRVRFYAALEHVRQGQQLRNSGKLDEAVVEFQRAADIDHTNFVAQEEARRTADMARKQARREEAPKVAPQSPLAKLVDQVAGPVELVPLSNTLINLRLTESSNVVYKTIGKLAGINVLFDPDYKPQKINVELNDVTLREALNVVGLETKTFWQPQSSNTILVAADTPTKRKEVQNTVMKTFYLRNVSTPSELQEAATTLRGILDVSRMQTVPNQNALIIRGTPDQMVLAEKLLADIDKPKAEVIVDIAVLQISRDRIRTLGVTPPTSASVSLVNGAGSGGSGGGGSTFSIPQLGAIGTDNVQITVGGATLTALMSDSNTKLIQNPEIRVLDNEKATLKIGDRVPVATGSFGATGGVGGTLVNTQFQYLDVGVNIDVTPHIHSEDEVTLKLSLEVSSVSGEQNIGGISQPVIGQRRIEHETRLRDGEVNLLGGILEDTETQSLSGYPWLTRLPVLKYLFGQDNRERQENEIVFAITPHIIRAQDLTEQNLRLVDLGPGTGVTVRYKDPRMSSTSPASTPADSGSSQKMQGHTPDQHAATPPAVSPQKPPEPAKVPWTPTTSSLPSPANSPSTAGSPVRALNQRAAPLAPAAAQASADPCPYGQHYVGQKNGVATCAFD